MTSNHARQPALPANLNGQQTALEQSAAVTIPPFYCPIAPAGDPRETIQRLSE